MIYKLPWITHGNLSSNPDSNLSTSVCFLPGGRQYGCSPQQILCHSASPKTPTGDHRRSLLHGAWTAHSVLQIDSLQTHQDHFLQRWSSRGTASTGNVGKVIRALWETRIHWWVQLNHIPPCRFSTTNSSLSETHASSWRKTISQGSLTLWCRNATTRASSVLTSQRGWAFFYLTFLKKKKIT